MEVVTKNKIAFPLGLDERHIVNIEMKNAVAPIYAGGTAGYIYVLIDGQCVAQSELIYASGVPENDLENAIGRVLDMWVMIISQRVAGDRT